MIRKTIIGTSGTSYSVVREIGKGGFGTVYLVRTTDGLEYAAKVLEANHDGTAEASFKQELTSAEGIEHANVLSVVDHGECEVSRGRRAFFVVTDYCADGSYRRRIQSQGTDREAVWQYVEDFRQILCGLSALHAQTIHRDIKPENVLIAGNQLRLSDFGLAKFVDEATRTMTFKGSGTPVYMASEVWQGVHVSKASDLYSVGIMLFEALTGKPPFMAEDVFKLRELHLYEPAQRVSKVNENVPSALDGIVKRLLEKDHRRRYQNCDTVLADLLKVGQSAESRQSDPNVTALAGRMRSHYDKEEAERTGLEKAAAQEAAILAIDKYMEQQILDLFDECVEELNDQLAETSISAHTGRAGREYTIGSRSLVIHFFAPFELYTNPEVPGLLDELRKHHVVHGGYIEIREAGQDREGWNLVLYRGPEEAYGEWKLIETRFGVLAGRRFKFDIAAIEARPFARNLGYFLMKTLDAFTLSQVPFDRQQVLRILGVFVPAT